jgi:UDP-N-acetylglucosamine 1-carboxyvinyltransferase
MILQIYGRLGVQVVAKGNDLLVPAGQALEITHDLGGAVAKIDDAPWPGFPADMTSIALITATQCRGTILIHEKMYESRLFFVDNLISMGAQIILCDPHRAVVIGPTKRRIGDPKHWPDRPRIRAHRPTIAQPGREDSTEGLMAVD